MATLEVCVDSPAGCRAARAGGAARVELCAGLELGGLTPSAGLLAAAREAFPGHLAVLVRPRPGDACYGPEERALLLDDVGRAVAAGADSVAVGVLTSAGDVDRAALAELAERARPASVTFHRAFDAARDPEAALEALVELGVARVLSSGGAASVEGGLERLAALVRRAGPRLSVVPAGGVRPHNAASVLAATGARELHASARRAVESAMTHRVGELALGALTAGSEYVHGETDADAVRALVTAISA